MTPEQLMQIRYKVIADYPFSIFSIGEIIVSQKDGKFWQFEDDGRWLLKPELFPQIFKPIQWYEERAEGDMPEYMKFQGEIFKVGSHFTSSFNPPTFTKHGCRIDDEFYPYYKLEPATEQEYNTYNNQTKNYKDEN